MYVLLHRTILAMRPRTVLELGSGRTTLVLAQALKSARLPGSLGPRLVSVDDDLEWHHQLRDWFPDQVFPFVELLHSPLTEYRHFILSGTIYRDVPELDFDLVFIDGPSKQQGLPPCSLDLVRIVSRSHNAVGALVDNRRHNLLALSLAFGRQNVAYFPRGKIGVVRPVGRADLCLAQKQSIRHVQLPANASIRRGDPLSFLL